MKIYLSLALLLFAVKSFSQVELSPLLTADKIIIEDSVYYDSFWERNQRKVLINYCSDSNANFTVVLKNCETDSLYIIGEAIVFDSLKSIKTSYTWLIYEPTYYIGRIDFLDSQDNIDKYYINFPDESVRSFTDKSTSPETKKTYFQGEYRLDLSIVKTFPKYFKELYEEKYGAINEP